MHTDSLKLCRVVGIVAVVHITLPTEYETDNSYSIITTQTPTKLNNSGYVCVLYPQLFCFKIETTVSFSFVLTPSPFGSPCIVYSCLFCSDGLPR